MPGNLRRLVPSTDSTNVVEVQDTTFAIDVLGRYVCSTWDEAVNNGGVLFDAIVIGAGMFGAYAAEKLYRAGNLRVLVLDAGPFLVSEHVQNLSRIGLNVPGAARVASNAQDPGTRERVWGVPWRSQVAFPGLAYCLGGRSVYWGGWAPRLTPADLAAWPTPVSALLQEPDQGVNEYRRSEGEIGSYPTADYVSGDLQKELKKHFEAVRKAGVPSVDRIEDAPLAVQAAPPASGLFSFDKFSSAPLLTEALREASDAPNWRRRLFLVPRAHVVRLQSSSDAVTRLEVFVDGQQRFLDVAPTCAVVLACGTIESTRLALESFATPLIGRNLMAHVRSNTTIRIRRSAFGALPRSLQAAALLVRGSTASGRYHLQVTAAAVTGSDPESVMFRMVPDIDLLDRMLASEDGDSIVITFRGIGEMQGSKDPGAPKTTGSTPSWMDLSPDQLDEFGARRAWVNLVPNANDLQLWRTMDDAAIAFAQRLAGTPENIQYLYNRDGSQNAPGADWHDEPPPPSTTFNRDDPANKVRDGVGTTHHEAGTLWMGTDPATSVCDVEGRLHHRANVFVAGPALFPAIGSANPSLTALTLARSTVQAITRRSLTVEPGFRVLGNGGLRGWRMAGRGSFMELGANIIESVGGIGLLWFTERQFDDFVLRLDWRASDITDNSGVFFRFPALGNRDPENDWKLAVAQGYEVQIDARGYNPDTNQVGDPLHATGAVYALAAAVLDAARPLGQWNTFEIEARGQDIRVRLNGTLVSQLRADGSRPRQGYIGLQNHHDGSRVQFRNLCIEPLGVVAPAVTLGAPGATARA